MQEEIVKFDNHTSEKRKIPKSQLKINQPNHLNLVNEANGSEYVTNVYCEITFDYDL